MIAVADVVIVGGATMAMVTATAVDLSLLLPVRQQRD